MKDKFRRKWFEVMGWMARPQCPCCNWTLGKHRKKDKRTVNKQVRHKLKEELRNKEE